jgi:hypothetical protein
MGQFLKIDAPFWGINGFAPAAAGILRRFFAPFPGLWAN